MRKLLVVLMLFFVPLSAAKAQYFMPDIKPYKTRAAQLEALVLACDSLREISPANVFHIAKYGLSIAPESDYANKSRFKFYISYSYWARGTAGASDTAILYMQQSLNDANQSGEFVRVVNALQELLTYYLNSPGYEAQRDHTAILIANIVDTTKSDLMKSRLYNNLADYNKRIGFYEKAVAYQLSDLELSTKLLRAGKFTNADTANYGAALISVAETYLEMGQPAKAMEYIPQSQPFFYDYISGQVHYYKNMIVASLNLEDRATAYRYYDSLTDMAPREKPAADQWFQRVAVDLTIADYFLEKAAVDSAWFFIKKAREIAPTLHEEVVTAETDFMTAKVLVAKKEYSQALPLLQSAEPYFTASSPDNYATLLHTIAQCHAGMGNWEEAGKYYARYVPLRDSLYVESAKQSIANAEARYQNRNKQEKIEAQSTQLAYARTQRYWLLAGIAAIGLIAILLLIIYRNKKKNADLLSKTNLKLAALNSELDEANKTKAKLFGIISHDLRSPISQIYQFLRIQQIAPDKLSAAEQKQLGNRISSATKSLLETMEDLLLWSKSQMNQFKPDFESVYLHEIVKEINSLLQLSLSEKQLSFEVNIPEDATIFSDIGFLQTIIRNLLQNAIKAAPAGSSIVLSWQANLMTIKNEGGYFSQQQYLNAIASGDNTTSLNGLGLKLIAELSKQIDVDIVFADTNDNTTQANLHFLK